MKAVCLFFISLVCFASVHSQSTSKKEGLQKFNELHDSILQLRKGGDQKKLSGLIARLEDYVIPEKIDSLNGIVYYLKGGYHYGVKNFDSAMSDWNIAVRHLEKAKDSIGLSMLYNEMSVVFMSTSDVKKGLQYKKKALAFCSEKKHPSWYSALLSNVAFVYSSIGELDSLQKYANRSYKIALSHKDSTAMGRYYMIMIQYANKLKNYDDLLAYSDTITKHFNKFLQNDILEKVYYRESVALLHKNKPKEALEKAELCLDILLDGGVVFNLPSIYEHLSNIHDALGNKKKALEFLKKSNKYRDSLFVKEQQQTILDLETKYQSEKKENENLRLREEASAKDLTIARKNNYILFGSLVFLIALGGLTLFQLRKSKKKNEALKQSITLRENAEAELELVRDNIAKDFHDDMGNKLARITALSDLMISSSRTKDRKDMINALKNIRKDSDVLYKGTRDFMFSLKAKNDYVEELFTYLSDFGEEYFQVLDIDFFVEKDINSNVRLPHYWNRHIILIFKEAMTNTAKYAEATQSKLSAKIDSNSLKIIFEDNGKGFVEAELKRTNGLENMRLRAQKINGNLDIKAGNFGTKVSFKATLPNSGGIN